MFVFWVTLTVTAALGLAVGLCF